MDQKQLMRTRHEAGCYRSNQGGRRGKRGGGGGGSVAAVPGRRWHRCGGPAGSGPSHLRGGAVAGAPGAQSGPEGSGQGGRQGGGAGAECRPAPARRAAGGGVRGAGRRWSWEGDSGGAPGGRSWALGRGSREEPEVLTPLPAAPSPPGAPAEAARGPQGVLRAHQAERHLRALLRQQQQRHPAQAPQHGGPRLRLPRRPRPHRPALRGGGGPETPSAVPAQAETSPAPSQLRQGGSEASLLCPHPARGWSSPGPLPHRVPGGTLYGGLPAGFYPSSLPRGSG